MFPIELRSSRAQGLVTTTLLLLAGLGGLAWLGGERDAPPSAPERAAAGSADLSEAAPRRAAGSAGVREPVREAGFYGAPVGSRFTYSLEARSEARMLGENDQRLGGICLEFAGQMRTRISARRPGELIAEIDFPGLSIDPRADEGTVDPEGARALAQELGQPTLVRLDDEGRLLGFRFAPGVGGEGRNLVRTLVSLSQFVVPAERERTWQVDERDAVGRYGASYRWQRAPDGDEDAVLAKRKLAYAEIEASAMLRVESAEAEGSAMLSPALGWIRAVSWHEQLTARLPGRPFSSWHRLRADLQLEDWEIETPAGFDQDLWDAEWQAVAGQEDQRAGAPERRRAHAARMLAGVTLEDLVAELDQLLRAGGDNGLAYSEAMDKLAWLIRLRPEALDRIRAMLASGLDAELANGLLSALGGAQSAPAQDFLAETFGDATTPESERMMAVLSMAQIESARPSVLRAIRDTLELQSPSPVIEDTSLRILGCLAGAGSEDAAEAYAWLVAREYDAAARGHLPAWLAALGNAGRPETLGHVRSYLAHKDPILRWSAASALRSVAGQEVNGALLPIMLRDPSPLVRQGAAGVLSGRSSPEVLAAVGDLLRQERDPHVRRQAIDGLATQAHTNQEAASLLRLAAEWDPEPKLHQLARELLGQVSQIAR